MSIIAWLLYGLSKGLVFVHVASALIGTHRGCLIVASFGQELEIQCLVPRRQIVSADLPSLAGQPLHVTITREEGSGVMLIVPALMQHLWISNKVLAPDWPVCTLEIAPTNQCMYRSSI